MSSSTAISSDAEAGGAAPSAARRLGLLRRAFALLALVLATSVADAGGTGAAAGLATGRGDKVVRQQWDFSCGAAALATILTWQQGDPVTEQEVVAGLLKSTSVARVNERHGFSLLDLKRYAEARGYLAYGYGEVTMDDLVGLGPAIVPIRVPGGHHFVVFRGVRAGWVLIGDPARGTRLMPADAFKDAWADREAFVLRRTDGAKPPDELTASPADFAPASPAAGAGKETGRARQPPP